MREGLMMMRVVVLTLWPVTAWAAGESLSLGATLGTVSVADWLSLVVLSAFSGLVALLHRVRRNFEAVALEQLGFGTPQTSLNLQRIDWRLFAAAHMAGAMFVGALAFLICEAFDIGPYLEAAAIALASWSGAKLADQLADVVSDGFISRVGGAIGKK